MSRQHSPSDSSRAGPSGPAANPTWTTGENYGVGTACDHHSADPSRVWFTLTEGALTEPRFPRVDLMNFRTVDFLVADSDDAASYTARTHNESRRDDDAESLERGTEPCDREALVYRQRITERDAESHEWELTVEYVTDPAHDAILLDVEFRSHDGDEYDLYVVGNTALSGYVGDSVAARRADREGFALTASEHGGAADVAFRDEDDEPYDVAAALASGRSFDWATVGTATDEHIRALFRDGDATGGQERARDNTVLIGRVGSGVQSASDTVALGFTDDGDVESAYREAAGALDRGYGTVRDEYVAGWRSYLDGRPTPDAVRDDTELEAQYRAAVMALRAVEDKTFEGASVASPSVPWGDGVDATEPRDFGYNFTWSRDLYQVFTALSAVDDVESARKGVEYLYEYQQHEQGFLPQNTYVNGRTRWGGEQLDNVAFPAVMAYQLAENHGVGFADASYDYADVRRSTEYVLRSGPTSEQERWEEEGGYSPSTIAAEAAGLACAAALADSAGERADALAYLAHADWWRLAVDDWCGTETGTDRHDRTPYYVRVSGNGDPDSGLQRTLANNGPTLDERDVIDAGFLELVRLGLRDPDEGIIRNSLAEVDGTIRVETPNGPGWYRYNGDGYGELGDAEPDQGGPWDVERNGAGRLWPIFTGERAEYELLADTDETTHSPTELLRTMQRFANDGRMIPEQVWDREDGTAYGWEFGEGTGAATPLAWSMAQYVRLAHAIDAGEPIETPQFIAGRYRERTPSSPTLTVERVDHGGGRVYVAGETDGAEVVLWTPETTRALALDNGQFGTTVDGAVEQFAVVAATGEEDLVEVGTAIEHVAFEGVSRGD